MKVLALVQLPPPVHGASLINRAVLDTLTGVDHFDVEHFDISSSKTISEMQQSARKKVLKSFVLFSKVVFSQLRCHRDVTYLNAAPAGLSALRDFVLLTIAYFRSSRVLVHFHGQIPDKSIFKNRVVLKVFKNRAEFIFLGPSLVPFSYRQFSKTHILPNFVPNEADYKSEVSSEMELPVVCFLANMLPAKGIKEFLEVCASSLRGGRKFSVSIAGDWTQKYTSEDYASWLRCNPDVAQSFRHVGSVGLREKIEFLSGSDIFIYPSHNDAFPLVLLEAMISGVAIVPSDVGEIRGIVGEETPVYNPASLVDFRKRLEFLLDHPKSLFKEKNRLMDRYYSLFSERSFKDNLLNIFGA